MIDFFGGASLAPLFFLSRLYSWGIMNMKNSIAARAIELSTQPDGAAIQNPNVEIPLRKNADRILIYLEWAGDLLGFEYSTTYERDLPLRTHTLSFLFFLRAIVVSSTDCAYNGF